MKKLLLMIAFVMATVCANAQIIRLDELEKYYREVWRGMDIGWLCGVDRSRRKDLKEC